MEEFLMTSPVYIRAVRLEADNNITYPRPAISIDDNCGWCCYDRDGEFPALQMARIFSSGLEREDKEEFINWLSYTFSLKELKEILKNDIYNWFYAYTGDNRVWYFSEGIYELLDDEIQLYFDIRPNDLPSEVISQIEDHIDYDKITDYTTFFEFCEEEGVIDDLKDRIDRITSYEEFEEFVGSKMEFEDFYELFGRHAWEHIDDQAILNILKEYNIPVTND